ncbi:MAG: S9 family peptidase [Deltaproteobacteria bacterium]|nr:S9 family peptidase [Deltaproteobacteria bacterium]
MSHRHRPARGILARLILALLLLASSLVAAAEEIVPGDNLVVDGIPKIPASLAEQAGRYSEFGRAVFLDWHPVRKEMLINTRLGNTYQLYQLKFPGAARTQLTHFDDNVFAGRYEPTEGRYLVVRKDAGGNEQFQYYRHDFAAGATALLTDGKSRNGRGLWSRGGNRMAYTSTRRSGKDTDLYLIEPSNPQSDRLVTKLEGGGWAVLDWSPDDRHVALSEYLSVNEANLWIVDIESGAKKIVTRKDSVEKVAYSGAKFSKDGKGLYTISDHGSEFRRLAYLDLAGGRLRFISENFSGDVVEFDLSTGGSKIAFITNEEGLGKLYLLDLSTGTVRHVTQIPLGVLSRVKWHKNGRHLGFNLSSARLPAEAFSLDLQTGLLERWTYSETGGFSGESFVQPELIRWKSFDGLMILGFLYRPAKKISGKRPVVINIHGGPEAQFRPGFLGNRNYFLNELGVAMIFPNVRGSSGYGKTFLKLDDGYLRPDAYKDIGALLDWIRSQADLDAGRVLVAGGSYGGHMALAVSYLYSDRVACSVDIVGPSNLVTFLESTADYRRDLRRAEYGDERDPKMRAYLEQIAPLNHVEKIRKPMLVVQGRNDPRVPRSEAEQLVAALKKNGTPVWYLMAKDEGHGFAKKKNADFQFYATILFMKECLLK